MASSRHISGWLASLALVLVVPSLRAETPPSPLRLIPDQADLVVQVDHPRQLVEAFTTLDLFKQLQQLDAVRDLYDSTAYQRFFQLVTHFEKQLGQRWPELLDQLAGGGIALGVKIGPNPAPVVLVIQSKDAGLLQRFAKLAQELVEQELTRQEAKERPTKITYRGVEVTRFGKELHVAVAGSSLAMSNAQAGMEHALNLHADGDKKSVLHSAGLAESGKLLPPDPLARLWFNLDVAHKAPQAKDIFTLPRNDVNQTVIAGGLLDIVGRSPFVAAGVYKQKDGFLTTVRLPRGRDGMPAALAVHVPPSDGATLPLLEPQKILF